MQNKEVCSAEIHCADLFYRLQKPQEKTVTALKRMVPHGPDVVIEAVGANAGHTLPYPAGL